MHDLYPINHYIPVVVLSKEYFVPFLGNFDKKSYLCVDEDGIHMRNHDFKEMTELVCSDLFLILFFEREFLCRHFVLMPPLLHVVTAIQNMAHQHRELYVRLDDS